MRLLGERRSKMLQWEREYWDTFMRDQEQERTAIRYIEANPVKAKLCRAVAEWPFGSARYRDLHRRLMLPSGKVAVHAGSETGAPLA
jgi:hypothetical protein